MAEKPGEALSRAIREGLPPGVELDEREQTLLAAAASQADDVAVLEADIAERGHVLESGRLNPCVLEVRQGRTAMGRLLAGIDLPGSQSTTALRASKAAQARWDGREAS